MPSCAQKLKKRRRERGRERDRKKEKERERETHTQRQTESVRERMTDTRMPDVSSPRAVSDRQPFPRVLVWDIPGWQ